MKAKLILKTITTNWFPKCLCIIIAIILYLFAKTARLETKTFVVPLKVIEDGNLARTATLPSSVSVIIRSEPEKISSIQNGDIEATLDLSYYTKEGSYNVPVSAFFNSNVNLNSPVELTVYPESISVDLEERTRKAVSVVVPIYGNPVHGYEIENIVISPKEVIISGPKSMVANINSISTSEISIADRKDTFNDTRKILGINRHIQLISSDDINVIIYLKETLITKSFERTQVSVTSLNNNLEVEELPEISFTVSGSQLIVETFYPSVATVQADCSGITEAGEYEVPLIINIPDGLQVEEQSSTTVKIIVNEKLESLEKSDTENE